MSKSKTTTEAPTATPTEGLTSPLPAEDYQSEQSKIPSVKAEPPPEPQKVKTIAEEGIGPNDPYPTDNPPPPRGPETETPLVKSEPETKTPKGE